MDFFGNMLTIRIQKNHPRDLSIVRCSSDSQPQASAQSGLDRFAFALILSMNNNFGAGFARALCRLIG